MSSERRIRPQQVMEADSLTKGMLVGTGAALILSFVVPLLRILAH